MRGLTLVWFIALPALSAAAQEADAGTTTGAAKTEVAPAEPTGGGVPAAMVGDAGVAPAEIPAGVGRHFAFLWDAEITDGQASDVQLWVSPRWGRETTFDAVDLRAGVLQGLGSH